MNILATPLGWIMKLCYELISNYGIALLLFTFITRLVVFPLNIKQQKGTAKMSLLTPELEKLKKKYKNDKEKLNEETMKLYSKANANPMASCLPMIITLVILWSLIPVVYGPLTYVSDANKDNVAATNTLITEVYTLSKDVKDQNTTIEAIIKECDDNTDKLKEEFKKDKYKGIDKLDLSGDELTKVVEAVRRVPTIDKFILDENNVSANLVTSRPELVIFDIVKKDNGEYAEIIPDDYKDVREAAENFNYEFLGLSLGTIPRWKSITCLIPILSAVLQLLCTIISQRFTKKNNPAAANMGGSMKIMLYAMPLFSLWIGFSFPAGLGLYWIYSSLFSVIQVIVLNVIYTPEKVKEMAKKDMEKAKKKKKRPSMMERAIAAQNQQNGNSKSISDTDDDEFDEDRKLSKAEAKELQRKRLNEARRRMAEKYGDEYDDKE